jgi:hypothetical protein
MFLHQRNHVSRQNYAGGKVTFSVLGTRCDVTIFEMNKSISKYLDGVFAV